jgi:hypothetical protein
MKTTDLTILAEGKIPETAVLREVKITYQQDNNGMRTSVIDSIRYQCVDPVTYSNFTIKVLKSNPIITEEELEKSEDVVFLDIPVSQTLIKPYAIEYGNVKVSVIAPYVKLHNEGGK